MKNKEKKERLKKLIEGATIDTYSLALLKPTRICQLKSCLKLSGDQIVTILW